MVNSKQDVGTRRLVIWSAIIIPVLGIVGGIFNFLWKEVEACENRIAPGLAAHHQHIETLSSIISTLQLTRSRHQQAEVFGEPGLGLLESYIVRVRRDGKPHPLARQHIMRLVKLNDQILANLVAYNAHIKTEPMREQSIKYQIHAETYRDRWGVIDEIIENGDRLPSWQPFPSEFPSAVVAELDNRKSHKPSCSYIFSSE